ncbi:MAG: NGG1p interacting factor NIF3 [Candidatus Omnitrophica bacterium]|nr:NGG1p interacting factor NIF3 [Candidatus Omnitrophota bacterium]
MKLKELYDFVVKEGVKEDPRGEQKVKKELSRAKKTYDDLKPGAKAEFDKESLENPYADTRILYGDADKEIKGIIIGVDMEIGELLLADRLRQKGKVIDLVIAHHPEGRALAGFYKVMNMQVDILAKFGVPEVPAENLFQERIEKVARSVMPVNHTRAVDAAKLLDIPFMCCHTPTDNHVASFLQKIFDKKKADTLGDIIDILKKIPEYKEASGRGAGPAIISGRKQSRAGRVLIDMTGGTEGSSEIFKSLAGAGVGTIVGMHFSEEHLKKAKEANLNMIIAGHISSDTLGINLLLDKLEKKCKIKIECCSGFRRFKR